MITLTVRLVLEVAIKLFHESLRMTIALVREIKWFVKNQVLFITIN